MGQAKQRGTKKQRAKEAQMLNTLKFRRVGRNIVIDTISLKNDLLALWMGESETYLPREEWDLLTQAVLTSDKDGTVRFFSSCERTDFVLSTYEILHKKIVTLMPWLKIDKQIRFFTPANYTLKTQEQIIALLDERYSRPTPINEICTTKKLRVQWFKNIVKTENTYFGGVDLVGMSIDGLPATIISKAILRNADENSFTWDWDKDIPKNPTTCFIQINTSAELDVLLEGIDKKQIKVVGEKISELRSALVEANDHCKGCGFSITFSTKRALTPKSERKAWVKPKPIHYTQKNLKERHWTPRLIEKWLGEPDDYFRNTQNQFSPIKGYKIARVKKIEKNKAFIEDFHLNRLKPVKLGD